MSKKLKVGLRVIGKTKQCLGWKGIITAIVMIDAKKRFVVKFDIQGDKTVTSVAIKKDDGGAPLESITTSKNLLGNLMSVVMKVTPGENPIKTRKEKEKMEMKKMGIEASVITFLAFS